MVWLTDMDVACWKPGKAGLRIWGWSRRFLSHIQRKVMRTALPAALVTLFINVFVTQAMVVQGPSMKPNLSYNHRVIVEKVIYRFVHGPRRGDVVVIDIPGEKELLVKRAVALPGGRSARVEWTIPRRSCRRCTSLSWATIGKSRGIPATLAPFRWTRSAGKSGSSSGRSTGSGGSTRLLSFIPPRCSPPETHYRQPRPPLFPRSGGR
jgi:hypothetical protein